MYLKIKTHELCMIIVHPVIFQIKKLVILKKIEGKERVQTRLPEEEVKEDKYVKPSTFE